VSQEGLTIDELARLAGSNVRNVRLYQERGLLPRPVKQGRTVRYGGDHLERLQLVRDLLSRGYSLAAIRELLEAWEGSGLDGLCATLGFKDEMRPSVPTEEPRHLSTEELQAALPGANADDINHAVEIGLLEPDGDGFITRSPTLFDTATQAVADGIPIATVLEAAVDLRSSMERLAERFIALFVDHFFRNMGHTGPPNETLTDTMQRYLVLSTKVVESEFARAIQKVMESVPASGPWVDGEGSR
jgi:DNA-binding transcriptional MerR regulator